MPASTVLPRTKDPALNDVIERAERAVRVLEAQVLNGMVLVTQAIGLTDTRVYHGLGRVPLGYFIVRAASPTTIGDGATPETLDAANYITLRVGSAQTVTVAVF